MFTVRLYPLLMVVLLALVSGQFPGRATIASQRVNRLLAWSAGIVLTLLLTACVGFDSIANDRIRAVASKSIFDRLDGLEDLNPDIGPGLVELAEYLVEQENDRSAMNAYRLAVKKLEGGAARRAQFRLKVVHERIKAEMLESSRRRREGNDRGGEAPALEPGSTVERTEPIASHEE